MVSVLCGEEIYLLGEYGCLHVRCVQKPVSSCMCVHMYL